MFLCTPIEEHAFGTRIPANQIAQCLSLKCKDKKAIAICIHCWKISNIITAVH